MSPANDTAGAMADALANTRHPRVMGPGCAGDMLGCLEAKQKGGWWDLEKGEVLVDARTQHAGLGMGAADQPE